MMKYVRFIIPVMLAAIGLAVFLLLSEPRPLAAQTVAWPYPSWETYQVFEGQVDCNNPNTDPMPDGPSFALGDSREDAGESKTLMTLCVYEEGAEYTFISNHMSHGEGFGVGLTQHVNNGWPNREPQINEYEGYTDCDVHEMDLTVVFTATTNDGRGYIVASNASALGLWSCPIDTFSSASTVLSPFDADLPEDYCPDGIELITEETVELSAGGSWSGSTETDWNRMYARAVFEDPGAIGLIHYVNLELNDTSFDMTYYGDEMQSWTPGGGYTNDPYTMTVPNRTFQNKLPYERYGFAVGPGAAVTITNGYNPLDLLSVCVVPHYGPSEYCEDGIEAVNGGPLYMDAFSGFWDATVPVTSTHIAVRYVVENLDGGRFPSRMKAIPGIEYTLFYVTKVALPGDMITFTLPTTGVVKLYDDDVYLEFYNQGMEILLHSACVVDADAIMPQLTEEECHLINPDFVDPPSVGWDTTGTVTWTDLEENGVIQADAWGTVMQAPIQTRGSVWKLEVRAKGDGGTLYYGTTNGAMVTGGPQMYSATLGTYYNYFSEDIFVMDPHLIQVSGDNAMIDSVCLAQPDTVFPIIDCTFPEWDPDGSGDSLLIYLFRFIGEVIKWGVCEVVRAISLAASVIFGVVRSIMLRIPALPNPGDGLISWVEWFGLLVDQLLSWFGINIPDAIEWFPRNGARLVDWLFDLYEEFIFWLAEQLDVDPYALFAIIDAIWNEALLFWDEINTEIGLEFQDLLLLLQNTANVLIVLVGGVREGVSGDNVAYIGTDFSGVGRFIWIGVEFINETVASTPLSALNLVSLGAIAIVLTQWTIKKFVSSLESLS